MSSSRDVKSELLDLLDALCEERLTPEQAARLERIVLKSRSARKLYLEYLHLHGTLLWDAAQSDGVITSDAFQASAASPVRAGQAPASHATHAQPSSVVRTAGDPPNRRARRAWIFSLGGAVSLVALAALAWRQQPVQDAETRLISAPGQSSDHDPMYDVPRETAPHYRPFRLSRAVADTRSEDAPVVAPMPEQPVSLPTDMVAFIDEQIEKGWRDAGIEPTPVASDVEWLRRAYLDLAGRIPSAATVEQFLADSASDKRRQVVNRLLADKDFDRHFATVWTNLLVGRSDPKAGDRDALFAFLQKAFTENQPWDATVAAFVSAEGSIESDPAANFLVAHLNNEAVPATAITARVFLGTQVQCMQCHNHPFNDWTQQDFWELNSFFQQTGLARDERGKPMLISDKVGGPTLFEARNGLMKAAYPKYHGQQISEEPTVNRRKELARLLASGDKPQMAVAFVNRTWAQLLGAGFTNPIDDMGPHNPPSHPEVLDRLSRAFVASGYDVKKLVRWITSTKAYHLSSRFNETNLDDDPKTGAVTMFSRAYTKPMTVEQVYDSLIVATRSDADSTGPAIARRDDWVKQFVRTYETDENDESVHFEGSVLAALALMNGETVRESLEPQPGTTLHAVLATPEGEEAKLRALALATLNRPLTEKELSAFRRIIRQQALAVPLPLRKKVVAEAYQDALWAMLNSGEFVTVP